MITSYLSFFVVILETLPKGPKKTVSDTPFATMCCIAWYQSKHWSSKLDLNIQSTITLDPKPVKPPQTYHLRQSTIQQVTHCYWLPQSSEASNHTIWTPQVQAATIDNKIQTSKFVKPIQHTENQVRPTHSTNRSK